MPSILRKYLTTVTLGMLLGAAMLMRAADCHGGLDAGQLTGQKVAVVVYPQSPDADRYVKTAQSRIESILADNDITALDRQKVEELKDVFSTLDDPGAFVTAEDFVENAEKFDMAALAAIYLHVAVVPGLADYFTASAHADLRFIGESDARVTALSVPPMGAPGRPPSDGLTQNSAAINAVQRAVDEACAKLGLENLDPATPRSVRLELQGPLDAPAMPLEPRPEENSSTLAAFAQLEKQAWRGEKVSSTVLAPAGALGAVAGYIIDTDFRRRPPRLYGSRIHLIDTREKREIQVLECFGVEKKRAGEAGSREIQDCMFVSSWRYLAAVSGGKLFFWDTERGRLMADPWLKRPVKKPRLGLARGNGGLLLVVDAGRHKAAYRIVRAGQ